MSLSTYSELKTDIAEWCERGDLTSRIPDFIRLAEAKVNRRLRTRRQMTRVTTSVSAGYVNAPADFLDVVSIVMTDGASTWEIDPAPQEVLDGMMEVVTTGRPRFRAIVGNQLRYFPAPDRAYSVTMTYFAKIPALGDDAPTNWLLDEYPDVYLYGALREAGPFLKDNDMLSIFKGSFDEAMDAVEDAYPIEVGTLRSSQLVALIGRGSTDLFQGSSGVTPTPDPGTGQDETPSPFFFSAVTDADGLTTYVSNAINVTGIDAGVEVDVTIDTGGLSGARGYSKDGAAYTVNPGTAILGTQLVVRLTTSADFSTAHTVTLTVGGVTGSFTVTTAAADGYSPSTIFSDPRNGQYATLIAA